MIVIRNKTLVVADQATQSTIGLADRAARNALPVLIVGESGTGKEMIARYIHDRSDRAHEPFVAVNCSAIPETLIEAELFGFERGAFTGAIYQKVGKFERASGGTLLLDEISEMPLHLQAKLLRVLQESEIDRIGGRDSIHIKTRIIATTNQDPWKLVQLGRFREDLYYRLNVIRVSCSPLRGRYDAISSLAKSFLERACECQKVGQKRLSVDAIEVLTRHSWPGNVRELENAIERAVLMTDNDVIDGHAFSELNAREHIACSDDASKDRLCDIEQQHILNKLNEHAGNRTHAARALGISVRTLRNKLKEYRA